jgi:hypothetical protein
VLGDARQAPAPAQHCESPVHSAPSGAHVGVARQTPAAHARPLTHGAPAEQHTCPSRPQATTTASAPGPATSVTTVGASRSGAASLSSMASVGVATSTGVETSVVAGLNEPPARAEQAATLLSRSARCRPSARIRRSGRIPRSPGGWWGGWGRSARRGGGATTVLPARCALANDDAVKPADEGVYCADGVALRPACGGSGTWARGGPPR